MGNLFAIGTFGGVFSLPEVVVDLVDAARAGLAVLRSIGLEAALIDVCFLLLYRHRCIGFADLVVLVNAPVEVRLARACARDGKDKDSILARMKCQTLMNDLSEGKEDPRIDYVIDNSGDCLELGRNTASFVEKMLLNKNVTTM